MNNLYIEKEDLELFLPEEALFAVGFEKAIIGYSVCFSNTVVLYDFQKCIEILVERDGMTEDEAIEYMDYNVLGAYMGEGTPAFAFLKKDLL